MDSTTLEQLRLFLIFFFSGIIIGLLFDVFRIIRKSFNISDFHTYIEDIIFGLIAGIFLIFVIFIYNNGNIRLYMFISLFLGLYSYMKLFSKYFIKVNVAIVKFLKFLIYKIFKISIIPLKYIFNIIKRIFRFPFIMLTINIKRILNYKKNIKILNKKKDFTK